MDEQVRAAFIRLILSLDYALDIHAFASADAWSFIEELGTFEGQKKKIPEGARLVFAELSGPLGLRPGAPIHELLAALKKNVGATTYTDASLELGLKYIRSQINGEFTDSKAQKIEDVKWVPHKNYEFK